MTRPRTRDRPLERAPSWVSVKDGDLRTPMRAGDFLLQLGLVMRLPAKPREQAASPAQIARRRVLRTRLWLPLLAVTSGILFAASQLKSAPRVELPSAIVGVWQTTDPRYVGRELVLTGTTICQTDATGVLGTPENISGLSATTRGDTMAVTIQHQAGAEIASLQLVYVSSPKEYITLRNPEGVQWTRVRGSHDAPAPARQRARLTPPPVAPGKMAWEH